MKTCHVCGTMVEDKELICPECGATVVKATSGMSLKTETETKKKVGVSTGTTIGTGSGYTDILRTEEDDLGYDSEDFGGGSIPTNYVKTIIEDDGEHKSKKDTRFIKLLFKILFVCAAAFVGYLVITKIFLKTEKGAKSYQDVLDTYVEAVNDQDAAKMKQIVPKYVTEKSDEAESWLKDVEGVAITSYNIKKTEELGQQDIGFLEEDIKASTSKTAYIKECVLAEVDITASYTQNGLEVQKSGKAYMTFIKIEGFWYMYYDGYTFPLLNIN